MTPEIDPDSPVPPLPLMRDGRTPFMKWVDGDGPRVTPRYVYCASSWRNAHQPGVVAALRVLGIDCYDCRFAWRTVHEDWLNSTPAQWRDALSHPTAKDGYADDRGAMDRADCCVLVLPSGRSAHMEAAFMAAEGKPVFTIALEKKVEPELMNLLLGPPGHICVTMGELFDRLGCPK